MKLKFIKLLTSHPAASYEKSKQTIIPHTCDQTQITLRQSSHDYIAFLTPEASKRYVQEINPVWIPYEVKKL